MSDGRFIFDVTDDFVSSEQVPLVVVCGWFGSKDRNVRKYTDELKKVVNPNSPQILQPLNPQP